MNKELLNAIDEVLQLMGKRISKNTQTIKNNNKEFREKKDSDVSKWYKTTDRNKELLAENNAILRIQVEINNYLKKYKVNLLTTDEDQEAQVFDVEELFFITASGEYPIDLEHPGLLDHSFTTRLLKYFEDSEDYETCKKILDIHQKLTNE